MNYTICPLDTRYKETVGVISSHFNEDTLLFSKFRIEIAYLKFIIKHYPTGIDKEKAFDHIDVSFSDPENADINYQNTVVNAIREIEKTTKHEIKAIEYFIRSQFNPSLKISKDIERFIHFGLTSEDVCSLAYSRSIYYCNLYIKSKIRDLQNLIFGRRESFNHVMLGRTHGQYAVPTTFYDQLQIFVNRLDQHEISQKVYCKFGGAIGNLYSLDRINEYFDWEGFFRDFVKNYTDFNVKKLNSRQTTQTDCGQSFAEIFAELNTNCRILIDMCQDIWLYNSYGYFTRKKENGEIGSSTMPQKINPILFENAEGNLKIASMWFTFFSNELPISRLQRDLSGSTISRNLGMPFGYMAVALDNMIKGIEKLELNVPLLESETDLHHETILEYIQLLLKIENRESAYELINEEFAKKAQVSKKDIIDFLEQDELDIPETVLDSLRDFNINKLTN